ncbi:unannotated protein [freshwater metagenome]|uniref:Unannotated protein n=1 Tax=freshwater metagenome TaxID=449393 RepID=A0A6J7REJ7_9ZZZZ
MPSTSGPVHDQVRGVVFDYGGVLTTPVGESIRAWIARDAIDPQSFSRTIKSWLSRDAPRGTPIHRLELGEIDGETFNGLLAERLVHEDGSSVAAEGLLEKVFSGVRPDPEMIALVEQVSGSGVQVALLSNSWGNGGYHWELVDRLFAHVVISGRVGVRKPEPEAYGLILDSMGLAPSEVVFVDDAEPNVEGARRVGMHTVHHLTAVGTRAALGALIPALSTSTPQESR